MPRGATARKGRSARRATSDAAGVSKARSKTAADVLLAGASGSTSLTLSDRDAAWDSGAAEKAMTPAQLPDGHFWKDPDGDPKAKASYKLPFADPSGGSLTAVWKGVTASAGAVQGARGGVKIPSGDVAGVKAKVGAYYTKAAKQYKDDNIKPPWEANESAGQSAAFLLAYAETIVDAEGVLDPLYATGDDGDVLVGVGGSGPAMDSFLERLAFWEGELAMSGECSNCGHMAREHLGAENAGPCSMDDCDCQGMKEMTAAATVSMKFCVLRDAGDNFAAVTEGLAPEHATLVRLRLANLMLASAIELPEELQPASTLPERTPGADAPVIEQPTRSGNAASAAKWTAMFVPEGVLTDDGRCMAPGSISWRELPLTLSAMIETTEGGHIGAEVCGRIDRIWRDDAAGVIRAEGVFDSGEYGSEIARLVGEQTLRGISVDLAIHEYEIGARGDYFDADGNWASKEAAVDQEEPSILDLLLGPEEGEDTIFVVTKAVIGMTTVCPFPAFADSTISVAASLTAAADAATWTFTGQAGFTLVASKPDAPLELDTPQDIEESLTAAAAGMTPVSPPAEWFENPELEELTALTIDDDGRIFGHAWAWDTCHTGFQDVCVLAPHSEHDYAYFHLGEIVCEDGERVTCGKITFDTGHAGDRLSRADASAHYDHTGAVAADICVGEDEFGGWVAGALRPDVDAEKARAMRAAVLSGDWRNVNGNLELVALLAVNVPGFPVPRVKAIVAAGEPQTLLAAGTHRGMPELATLTDEQREAIDVLLERAQVRKVTLAEQIAALTARASGE